MYATARSVIPSRQVRLYLILILATAFVGSVLADADASLSEIYEAARTGHLERAQQMMNQVLRDHPKSAKAHYVRAELYAKQGNVGMGRRELKIALTLAPGLSFATPESVHALQTDLSRPQPAYARQAREDAGSSISWRALAVVALVACVVLWIVFRGRRSPGNAYSQARDAMTPPTAPPGAIGGTSLSPSVGSPMGTGIAGGLASGLAAGAGIVAGEEIAHRLLDPDRREDNTPLTSETVEHDDPGEPDFGISGGSSWDDNGPAPDDGSGNDDWS